MKMFILQIAVFLPLKSHSINFCVLNTVRLKVLNVRLWLAHELFMKTNISLEIAQLEGVFTV